MNAEAKALRAVLSEFGRRIGLRSEMGKRIARALGNFGEEPRWAMADFRPNGHDRQPEVVLVTEMLGRLRAEPTAPLPTLDQVRRAADVA